MIGLLKERNEHYMFYHLCEMCYEYGNKMKA